MKIRLRMDDVVDLLNGKEISPCDISDDIQVVIDEKMDTFYSLLAKKLLIPEFFMDQFRDKIKKL